MDGHSSLVHKGGMHTAGRHAYSTKWNDATTSGLCSCSKLHVPFSAQNRSDDPKQQQVKLLLQYGTAHLFDLMEGFWEIVVTIKHVYVLLDVSISVNQEGCSSPWSADAQRNIAELYRWYHKTTPGAFSSFSLKLLQQPSRFEVSHETLWILLGW